MSKHKQTAAALVESAITKGLVVVADDVLNRRTLSAGPYRAAVPTGYPFAVLGHRDQEFQTATEAAWYLVDHVGSTRAREAAKRALKQAEI